METWLLTVISSVVLKQITPWGKRNPETYTGFSWRLPNLLYFGIVFCTDYKMAELLQGKKDQKEAKDVGG